MSCPTAVYFALSVLCIAGVVAAFMWPWLTLFVPALVCCFFGFALSGVGKLIEQRR